jgi:DNA replication factor GINS
MYLGVVRVLLLKDGGEIVSGKAGDVVEVPFVIAEYLIKHELGVLPSDQVVTSDVLDDVIRNEGRLVNDLSTLPKDFYARARLSMLIVGARVRPIMEVQLNNLVALRKSKITKLVLENPDLIKDAGFLSKLTEEEEYYARELVDLFMRGA